MAKIEDIDISKPFAFFETKLETFEKQIEKMKPDLSFSFCVFDGSDTQLILDKKDRDIFYNLIINNKELRLLIEDIGKFQGGHQDKHGNPEIAAIFSREQLYDALKAIHNPIKDKIVIALSKWDNDFVTFNVSSL